jgi:peptidoglycan/xylan/chitin deacetylase (PgdA/CDA1 family)
MTLGLFSSRSGIPIVVVLFLAASVVFGQTAKRTIAVTIVDLPVVSTRSEIGFRRELTQNLLKKLRDARVPAIGFVNENKLYADGARDEKQVDLLRLWLDAGSELGNHTYSHRSLNRIELSEYTADILRGEAITRELLSERKTAPRFFRHPYLQTGRTMQVKRDLADFLAKSGYRIAPITFDNADYIFARAFDNARDRRDKRLARQIGSAYVPYMQAKLAYWEKQSVTMFGREVSQTLLIHANSINSEYFDDLARMLRRRGYSFVDLETALRDEAYTLPDNYVGPAGISWLHRWARDKGREYVVANEPKVPDFVLKASGFESE